MKLCLPTPAPTNLASPMQATRAQAKAAFFKELSLLGPARTARGADYATQEVVGLVITASSGRLCASFMPLDSESANRFIGSREESSLDWAKSGK